MGFYSNVIFPRLYDWLIDTPHWAKYRTEQLAMVGGDILEIGIGTGLNLPYYPKNVRKITTVDPSPGMNKLLQRRIAATSIEVDQRILGGEAIPFDGETFDTEGTTGQMSPSKSSDVRAVPMTLWAPMKTAIS